MMVVTLSCLRRYAVGAGDSDLMNLNVHGDLVTLSCLRRW
jgi:hypothetical protein